MRVAERKTAVRQLFIQAGGAGLERIPCGHGVTGDRRCRASAARFVVVSAKKMLPVRVTSQTEAAVDWGQHGYGDAREKTCQGLEDIHAMLGGIVKPIKACRRATGTSRNLQLTAFIG
jgi:hypothetical protein